MRFGWGLHAGAAFLLMLCDLLEHRPDNHASPSLADNAHI
jgi:hypothetical protein